MTLYGLIGKKLGHSFSARYFNGHFAEEGIDSRYELFEIPSVEGVSDIIDSHPRLKGLNVTIPYKQEVIPLLDSMTEEARNIGAVNCIRISRGDDGKVFLTGHNTDAGGFSSAIELLLGGRGKALMLGLGGASRAVEYALRRLGVKVTKVSRRKADGVLCYSDLDKSVMSEHDIVVNCTPLGMWPNTDAAPDIPYHLLDSRYLCFDLVYNPEETEFMRRSKAQGAIVSNGLRMLYNQADLAYDFWENE